MSAQWEFHELLMILKGKRLVEPGSHKYDEIIGERMGLHPWMAREMVPCAYVVKIPNGSEVAGFGEDAEGAYDVMTDTLSYALYQSDESERIGRWGFYGVYDGENIIIAKSPLDGPVGEPPPVEYDA